MRARGCLEFLGNADINAQKLVVEGRHIFRFDTFGDEVLWTTQLQIQRPIAQLTPRQALALGLKVDADALPFWLRDAIRDGHVNLDDPAVTSRLLRHDAVLGVVGTFGGGGELAKIGFTCALCHSTRSSPARPTSIPSWRCCASPIPRRIRPHNDPGIDANQVRTVLRSWGPGKLDAELFLDGKAFQPDGRAAATLIPNARGRLGYNLHTWTGGWGTVT